MKSQFIGLWRLQLFQIEFSDHREVLYPFGKSAEGQLIYTESGYMQALLQHENRTPFSLAGFEKAHHIDPLEKATAFNEYLSYGGKYEIFSDRVVHYVQQALNPSIIGTEQVRYYEFPAADQLLLHYHHPHNSNVQRHYQLLWNRMSKEQ